MADKFQGTGTLTLYPGDANVPVTLRFPPATGSTKNDGAVPYGSTIDTYSASATYIDDNSSSTTLAGIISSVTATSHTVTVFLDHTSDVPVGLHSIVATVTWDLVDTALQMTRPYDLDRVYVR